jgi:hypothetical protein
LKKIASIYEEDIMMASRCNKAPQDHILVEWQIGVEGRNNRGLEFAALLRARFALAPFACDGAEKVQFFSHVKNSIVPPRVK